MATKKAAAEVAAVAVAEGKVDYRKMPIVAKSVKDLFQKNQGGAMILIYSDTGEGKTTSCFESLPEPITYVQTEKRDPTESIRAARAENRQIEIAEVKAFEPLIAYAHEYLLQLERGERNIGSMVIDSFTYLIKVTLAIDIQDEGYESLEDAKQNDKPLTRQSKMSQEGYGALADQMNRLSAILGEISRKGTIIVCTALLTANPKYDRTLQAAPALKGKEFPENMPGFFDLIGKVSARYNEEGKKIFPPGVEFDSPDKTFMAKWTGNPNAKTRRILNFQRILEARKDYTVPAPNAAAAAAGEAGEGGGT